MTSAIINQQMCRRIATTVIAGIMGVGATLVAASPTPAATATRTIERFFSCSAFRRSADFLARQECEQQIFGNARAADNAFKARPNVTRVVYSCKNDISLTFVPGSKTNPISGGASFPPAWSAQGNGVCTYQVTRRV